MFFTAAESICVCVCVRVRVIVRALEVCVELNLTAGVEYYEPLVHLSVVETDRAKYDQVCSFRF